MRKIFLGDHSWTEHAEIDKQKSVVLIPLGVSEQHGPAGILGADYILAETLATAVAEGSEDVYVAPTLTHGYTPGFRHFSGSICLRPETLKNLLLDVVEGYISHGWRKIIIFNAHAGNDPIVDMVGREIKEKHKLTIGFLSPWQLAMFVGRDLYAEPAKVFGHGGEPTLSVMMALRPGKVDRARLEPGDFRKIGQFRPTGGNRVIFEGFATGFYTDTEEITASGANGDPTQASEEMGRKVLERMTAYATRYVQAFREALQG